MVKIDFTLLERIKFVGAKTGSHIQTNVLKCAAQEDLLSMRKRDTALSSGYLSDRSTRLLILA